MVYGSYNTWGQTKPFVLKPGNKAQWDTQFTPVRNNKTESNVAFVLPKQLMGKSLLESIMIIKNAIKSDATVRIFRVDGRLINRIDINDTRELRQVQKQLSNGVYFLLLSSKNKMIGSVKLILAK